jgi:5-methylcytosine-specific restriction endonuclease McrA
MLRRRTPLKRTALKKRTPIKKVGRVTRYRAERKKEWIRDYPPDEEGNYLCVLCPYKVHVSVMKLEHKLPKGSTPKAVAEADSNLGPSHDTCNADKGSQRIEWVNESPSSHGSDRYP